MKRKQVGLGLGVVVALVGIGVYLTMFHHGKLAPSQARGPVVPANDYRLSGPYTHENLTVFLVHGSDLSQGKIYLTLNEALDQKKVVVHETGQVNELALENLSPNEEVYVQSGDIVKGGQQDRVLQYDLVASPASGKISLGSFCVEHGRWQKRGEESVVLFDNSSSMSNNSQIKLAGKNLTGMSKRGQNAVWNEVAENQTRLSNNLKQSVLAVESPTSLQLSMENEKVKEVTSQYLQKLSHVLEGNDDVIGFAVAINGKIYSADVYASRELFKKLWPRLLRATAVEAIAQQQSGLEYEPVRAEEVKTLFTELENGTTSHEKVS